MTNNTTLTIPLHREIPPEFPLGKRHVTDTYTNKPVYDLLIEVRALMLQYYTFWGTWVVNLKFVEDPTGIIGTFCTDGEHVFYDVGFIQAILTPGNQAGLAKTGNPHQEILFIIAHEIMHCLGRHVALNGWYRGQGVDADGDPIDQKKFNYAADFYINNGLIDAGIGMFPTSVGGLRNPKYRGLTVEQIYMLLKDDPECANGGMPGSVGPDGKPDPKPDHGEGGFDTHVQIKKGAAGSDPTITRGENGEITITLPGDQFKELEDRMVRITHQAHTAHKEHEQASKSAGSLPEGVERIINDLMKPQINWRSALRRFVKSVKVRGYSMMNPNRSFFQVGISVPGFRKTREKIDMAFILDASGSMGIEQLTQASSELKGILDAMGDFTVLAWSFDGGVAEESVTLITKRGGNTLMALEPFLKNIKGGGGTSFASNWDWMKKKNIKPRIVVFFTDGYTYDGWGDPTYCPVMWLVTGDIPEEKRPGYGLYVPYKRDMQ